MCKATFTRGTGLALNCVCHHAMGEYLHSHDSYKTVLTLIVAGSCSLNQFVTYTVMPIVVEATWEDGNNLVPQRGFKTYGNLGDENIKAQLDRSVQNIKVYAALAKTLLKSGGIQRIPVQCCEKIKKT